MKKIEIYTDGACKGNPGPGGYGIVMRYKQHERTLSGGFSHTTNNRMELYAVIDAFSRLTEPCDVTLTSDSKYVIDAFQKRWVQNWARNGWITSTKKSVANRDLWERLCALIKSHRVTWVWVKGHAEHPDNNRCDALATAHAEKLQLPEDKGYTSNSESENVLNFKDA